MHRPRVSVPAWLCLAAALGLSAIPVASMAVSAEADKKPVQEKRQTWDEFMTIDLNAPVEELPALADAEARRQAFAARNSPENVERVAKELFALWDRSEGSPGHSQSLDSVHDEKSAVRKLFEDKQYDAALKAFRGYLIHRTAILWNARPNFASRDFYERASSTVMKRRSQDLATLSMKGVVQTGATKTTVQLGEPGLVHWEWRAKEMQNPWDNAHRPEVEYFNGSCFDKLWWKFVDTKDRAFLDRWVEFADDYTLNHHLQEDLSALNVDLGKAGLGDVMNFLLALGELSRAVPDGEELVPAMTVARMMIKHLTVIIPQSLYYNREQGNNHSPPTTASYLRLAEFIYDFRIARTIEHEARRQLKNYGTRLARPVGVGPGRLPGYSMFEFRENQPILQTFRDNEYEWLTPQLEREIRDRMVARARYQIATTAPSGETIVALKTDRHTASFGDTVAYLTRVLPEVFDEPEIARIANRIVRNQTQPGWDGRIHQQADKPVARLGMGGVGDEPGFASQGFPYDRTFIMSIWLANDREFLYGYVRQKAYTLSCF